MPLSGTRSPDRLWMSLPGLDVDTARQAATIAAEEARRNAPKLSGASARRIVPIFGHGWYGVHWANSRVWFQNAGVRPFLMRGGAGKVIPMWVDDTGKELAANPDAKTRVTASGKKQVLIFRRKALPGERKTVRTKVHGVDVVKSVPRSYAGAPGRITLREAKAPNTRPGKVAGQVAKGNIGIRWYFPGLAPRNFLQHGLITAAQQLNLSQGAILTGFDFVTREDEPQ